MLHTYTVYTYIVDSDRPRARRPGIGYRQEQENCPDRLSGPLSLLSSEYRKLFPGQSNRGVKATTHLCLVPRSRLLSCTSTPPYVSVSISFTPLPLHTFVRMSAWSTGLEWREYGRRDPSRCPRGTLYPQNLALTSPTSDGRSVGIVGIAGLKPRSLILGF
jgi:hypothetical protein